MSEQVEMEEDDRNTAVTNSNQSGEKKRFEVKKVKFWPAFFYESKFLKKFSKSGMQLLYGHGI